MEKGKISNNLSIEENFFDKTDMYQVKLEKGVPYIRQVKLAIIGTREFNDYGIMKDILVSLITSNVNVIEIVSGGADGADKLAERFAKEKDIPTKIFLPDWNNINHPDAKVKTNSWGKKYDASAGFRRNKFIIENSDVVVAFWNGKSNGTKNSLSIAKKLKKHFLIYNYETDEIYDSILNMKSENYIKYLRKEL